jgi:hypothetical protein
MNQPRFSRADFDQLLAQQQQLIELSNELEYRLYRMGEAPPDSPAQACQQAGGALLGVLRTFLFRQDQQVLPVLDALSEDSRA